jgi:hypothetical protein
MPCNQVERTVVLLKAVVLSIVFVDNLPISTQIFIDVGNRIQEVSRIGKRVATQRTQIRQLPHAAPDLCDVSSSLLYSRCKSNSESHTSLDDANLSRLQEDHSKLGLQVQVSLLSADEEVAIGVAERSLLHGCVDGIDVQSHSLSQVGIARATQSVQAIDKIYLFRVLGQREGSPFCLFGQSLDFGVEGEEAVLDVGL